jgi:CheY-like chemotaxis protein
MSPETHDQRAAESRIAELLKAPEPAAQDSISIAFARLARVAPLSCDASSNLMTMAIDDSGRIQAVQGQLHFLMTPFEPAFVTVSPDKLDSVLNRLAEPPGQKAEAAQAAAKPGIGTSSAVSQPAGAAAGLKPQIGAKSLLSPAGKPSIGAAKPSVLPPTGAKAATAGGKFSLGSLRPQAQQQPQQAQQVAAGTPDYAEMSRALLSAVSLMVRNRLAGDPAALASLQTIVRHCQMLAARVGISTFERDAVLTAAWLSGLPDAKDLLNQLPTPYHLDTILGQPRDGAPVRVERSIVEVVRSYQGMAERDAAACRDVNKVRRTLRSAVAQCGTEILEPFLGILMDEVFLSTLDRKAGTVLVVDPAEMASATLGPPLAADGYEVTCSADAAEAAAKIAQKKPDLIILAASLPDESGASFCRRMKRDKVTAGIPIIVLLSEADEKLAAECLRAGAEDVLSKPVPLELLFLKLQRFIDAAGETETKSAATAAGVSGSLADMAFTDMIQILSAGGKSVEIRMSSANAEGRIFLQGGKIIHAAVGDQQGEEAFYTMMSWREGSFSMRPPAEFPERTIHTDAMGLLMEGAKRLDDLAEQGGGK